MLDFENGSAPTEPGRHVDVRRGRELEFRLTATDPEGDPIRYSAEDLPPGAKFEPERAKFRWIPAPDQVGDHRIRFIASDGKSDSPLDVSVHVAENQAPVASTADAYHGDHANWELSAGNLLDRPLAEDPDGDKLDYRALSLPRGATLAIREGKLWISWQPEEEESGEFAVSVSVSDGELTTVVKRRVFVHPAWGSKRWQILLAPSFGYELYAPLDEAPLYHGFSSELTFIGSRKRSGEGRRCAEHPNDECFSSHLRLYAGLEVLFPSEGDGDALFAYGLGFTRSFEFSPARRFLIPHYGIEFGALTSRSLPHLFQTLPYIGFHLYAERPVWLNLTAGMRVVPARLEEFFGPRVALSLLIDTI